MPLSCTDSLSLTFRHCAARKKLGPVAEGGVPRLCPEKFFGRKSTFPATTNGQIDWGTSRRYLERKQAAPARDLHEYTAIPRGTRYHESGSGSSESEGREYSAAVEPTTGATAAKRGRCPTKELEITTLAFSAPKKCQATAAAVQRHIRTPLFGRGVCYLGALKCDRERVTLAVLQHTR